APDHLALPGDLLAGGGIFHLAGGGGAVDAVEPAVGAPLEVAHDGVGVLDAEASEPNLGIGVGHVVAIGVGIEQEVGRIGHPDASVADGDGGGDVEAGDDIL